VPAYSTLGWFNDPLLSTFINYPDAELARLIFHELAHQVVYVQGDSQFNESFASAVEEAGVERWLELRQPRCARLYALQRAQAAFPGAAAGLPPALEPNYAAVDSDAEKRADQGAPVRSCRTTTRCSRPSWGGYAGYDRFFAEPLSNAHLAAIATYNDFVPAFRALLAREKSFPVLCRSAPLAELDQEERHRRWMKQPGGRRPRTAAAARIMLRRSMP
jgi:predicted aminopeptidase